MKGSDFPEAVIKLKAPEGYEDEVYELPIWRHPEGGMVISKWKMTWRERLACLFQGYVWFHCWGNTHPPMSIETTYPFEKEKGHTFWRLIILWVFLTWALGISLFFYFKGAI